MKTCGRLRSCQGRTAISREVPLLGASLLIDLLCISFANDFFVFIADLMLFSENKALSPDGKEAELNASIYSLVQTQRKTACDTDLYKSSDFLLNLIC